MRILGIDIGSTSVKAVELDSAFRRYEVHEYHEAPINPGVNPAVVVAQLVSSLPTPPDRICTSMRTGMVTFRNLEIPTRDRKAIQTAIQFELDDDLPYPVEDSVYDSAVLSQVSQQTWVHVATTLKKHLVSTLDLWKNAGVEPDVITSECWAYRTLMNRVLDIQAQDMPVMLVKIGHERTTLYIHWRGRPIVARDISWGGRDLTLSICKKYGIPLDQAERAKLDNGFVLAPSQRGQATQEQTEFSDAVYETLSELISAIRQAILTCKNATHENLESIYLAGGTALLPGLGKLIHEELRINVLPFHSLSAIAGSGVTYSAQTDATFIRAAAAALCQITQERSTCINLRKGEFAPHGKSKELNLTAFKRPILAASLILMTWMISLGTQFTVFRSQAKEVDQKLERSVKSFFGQLSSSAVRSYMSNPTLLKKSVEKEITKQQELSKLQGQNPRSPLTALKSFSKEIPKNFVVDLMEFQVGAAPEQPYSENAENTAKLTFLVSNPQIAEKLAEILTRHLDRLDRSKMEETDSPDGGPKRWKISFTGSPKENVYGSN